jgi:putative transposase
MWHDGKKALKRHGLQKTITTDGLRSYGASVDELGNRQKQKIGRCANNRVENSHLPFRRRKWAMLRFRQMQALQKFASVHANVYNHFSLERHFVDQQTYSCWKSGTSAAGDRKPDAERPSWVDVRNANRSAKGIRS